MANTPTARIASEGEAQDLSNLLRRARDKAEGWIDQRTVLTEHLTGIRDTANGLLDRLGMTARDGGAAKAKRGRPRLSTSAADLSEAATGSVSPRTRKPRTMSPEARARISAAQKKRWAK